MFRMIIAACAATTLVSGAYALGAEGHYTFTEPLTVTMDRSGSLFNCYGFKYSCDEPLCGEVAYRQGGVSKTETFYLEAGTDKTFTSLTDDWLAKKTADALTTVTLRSIRGTTATLTLSGVTTELRDVPSSKTIFLENDHYKVGVDLAWGGGISYIEDKKDNDPELGNLINRHDTGRLVQQSYYCTRLAPYVCGRFNKSQWPYNPVQGGDQYQNRSKLVDLKIMKDRIYIKCLPRDWAQKCLYTKSYMENIYTLIDGGIRVDNRFEDFSNYTPQASSQELPAFYTLSRLGTFTFYGGKNDWTGDPQLTVRSELKFWGDERYNKDCSFDLHGSKETWCAWTGPTGYGIGLYVPEVTALCAGRSDYNGSADPGNNSTNYVAPIRHLTLKSFEPFTYSYIISTGTVAEMREYFTAHKDFAEQDKDKDFSALWKEK